MADLLRGPVAVTNLTAAAGVTTTVDGWWPCLDITWRTPVPPTVTRLVAQVRERGTSGPVAETVVTPGDGMAKIVNGVSVGQHLEVRLSAAGAPRLPFQATPWLEVTTSWDALMAALDGLSLGCFKIVCGVGVPTRTDLPIGSLYVREDVSQLWRYSEEVEGAYGVNIVGTDLEAGTNIVTLSGYTADRVLRFSKPTVASSGGLLTWDAYSRWSGDANNPPGTGLTWLNDFGIYGNNGGSDVLLYSFPVAYYVDAAAAQAALAADLPTVVTGYSTYKIVGVEDSPSADNRGGLSILVEELAGWVRVQDVPLGTATASEALSAGNICNYHASSGAKIRKADATDLTKPANCFVLSAYASGDRVKLFWPGEWITGLSGLTPGATYWLDTTAGAITTSPPAADAGHGSQIVGYADETGTRLFFAPQQMNGI